MAIPQEALMELWRRALAAKIGVAIKTNDRGHLSRALYAARQDSKEEALMDLTIQRPAKSDEIWICHKSIEIPEEEDDGE